jgi:hypothetical protein
MGFLWTTLALNVIRHTALLDVQPLEPTICEENAQECSATLSYSFHKSLAQMVGYLVFSKATVCISTLF